MRRLIYSVATSLDGYIAGPKGEFDWIMMDPEIDFASLMSRFDAVIMGRKTFAAMQGMGSGHSSPLQTIVVSRTLKAAKYPGVVILQHNLKKAITQLKQVSGKDIWLFGGGQLFQSLLKLGLVDGIELGIMPVLLGKGIPFLPAPAAKTQLQMTRNHTYPKTGIVWLEYTVLPAQPAKNKSKK